MEKGLGKWTDTLQTDKVFTRKEYIEREAAINAVFEAYADGRSAYIALEDIPAADVREVVRCRECKHRDPEDKKCDCGGLEHAHMFPVADDWFCADGEKREVEHD